MGICSIEGFVTFNVPRISSRESVTLILVGGPYGERTLDVECPFMHSFNQMVLTDPAGWTLGSPDEDRV